MALEARGVEIRRVRAAELGRIELNQVKAQIDGRTRLVALASGHFLAGVRLDVSGIGACLRERGIAFCVDGIQTLGAFPTPLENVDFLAADAHKWLLGPCAAGILYVKMEAQEQLSPSVFGWSNVSCPHYIAQEKLVFPPDARRYEAGSANLAGLAGLKAALELLLEVGIDAIAADLLRKRQWMIPAIRAQGYEVLAAEAGPQEGGAIIAIHHREKSMADLHALLLSEKVVTSLRFDRAGTPYLRISPHFYNTDAELERFLDLIRPD
jgi:selenocysteine lyase/cysteine desulfurase